MSCATFFASQRVKPDRSQGGTPKPAPALAGACFSGQKDRPSAENLLRRNRLAFAISRTPSSRNRRPSQVPDHGAKEGRERASVSRSARHGNPDDPMTTLLFVSARAQNPRGPLGAFPHV